MPKQYQVRKLGTKSIFCDTLEQAERVAAGLDRYPNDLVFITPIY